MTNSVGNAMTLVLTRMGQMRQLLCCDRLGWCKGCARWLNYSGLQHNGALWPHLDITDASLAKSSKDGDGTTLGDLCKMAADRLDANDKRGALYVLDEEFLAGAWAHAFEALKKNHVQYTVFANDIRGLAVAMYKLGKERGQ